MIKITRIIHLRDDLLPHFSSSGTKRARKSESIYSAVAVAGRISGKMNILLLFGVDINKR